MNETKKYERISIECEKTLFHLVGHRFDGFLKCQGFICFSNVFPTTTKTNAKKQQQQPDNGLPNFKSRNFQYFDGRKCAESIAKTIHKARWQQPNENNNILFTRMHTHTLDVRRSLIETYRIYL